VFEIFQRKKEILKVHLSNVKTCKEEAKNYNAKKSLFSPLFMIFFLFLYLINLNLNISLYYVKYKVFCVFKILVLHGVFTWIV
jgi:hypothetical protein